MSGQRDALHLLEGGGTVARAANGLRPPAPVRR
ncbi:hypothetical protein RKD18_007527 [Streptomyces phaeoluteigriseus]